MYVLSRSARDLHNRGPTQLRARPEDSVNPVLTERRGTTDLYQGSRQYERAQILILIGC